MSATRAALVAGGSGGIGLGIARVLGGEGHALTIVGRRAERLERAAEALRGEGIDVQPVPANLADEDEIRRTVELHREHFGRLDVLVNSAGYGGPRSPVESTEVKHLDRILEVDLRSPLLVTRECIPLLREAGGEHGKALIVNVSSVASRLGLDDIAAYSAAKGGMDAFARAVQAELAGTGVKVTTLMPGYVDTPMSEWVDVPTEEMLRPADLAEGVRLLLRVSPACHIPELRFERRSGPV